MKKITSVWIIFSVIFFLSVISISAILYAVIPNVFVLWGVLALALVFLVITLIESWTQVPNNAEYIIEKYGKYIGEPIGSGVVLLFPWFNIFYVRKEILLHDMMMELYLDEKVDELYGGGDVEFDDCSSSVRAFFYFRMVDSAKATYKAQDVLKFIEEKADGILRSFLALYRLDDAIKLRTRFTLEAIACCIKYEDDELPVDKDSLHQEYLQSEFYNSLRNWGIEPVDFTISDIELPENVKAQRMRAMEADMDKQVSETKKEQASIDKDTQLIQAEAERQAKNIMAEASMNYEKKQGEGQSSRIRMMVESGLGAEQVANVMIAERKWNAVANSKNTDKTIILDSPGNSVISGAEFGVGFKSSTKARSKMEGEE